jgi:hypothetical protein
VCEISAHHRHLIGLSTNNAVRFDGLQKPTEEYEDCERSERDIIHQIRSFESQKDRRHTPNDAKR